MCWRREERLCQRYSSKQREDSKWARKSRVVDRCRGEVVAFGTDRVERIVVAVGVQLRLSDNELEEQEADQEVSWVAALVGAAADIGCRPLAVVVAAEEPVNTEAAWTEAAAAAGSSWQHEEEAAVAAADSYHG